MRVRVPFTALVERQHGDGDVIHTFTLGHDCFSH